MKRDITLKALEIIGNVTLGVADAMSAILSAGYGASYGKLQYEVSKRENARGRISEELKNSREVKQKYYNLISRLKKDGLIRESSHGTRRFFILTGKGKDKLSFLKSRQKQQLPGGVYTKVQGSKFVIVAFDIPEKERKKRDWLRYTLRRLGLIMVQKSLWMGKTKIPEEFIQDLKTLRLIGFVEIFEITKKGSLEHIA